MLDNATAAICLVDWRWDSRAPSLALGALKARLLRDPRLAQAGVETLEPTLRDDDAWVASRVAALRPRLLGLSCKVWNIVKALEFAREIKRLCPETFLVLGGPQAAPEARQILDQHPAVDAVAEGEGEETLWQLSRGVVFGERPISSVPGLWLREGSEARFTG